MGTRIAILRAGRLVQFDRPEAILAHPADAFVEAFVGSDRALKQLGLLNVGRFTVAGRRLRTRPPSASRATCATRCRHCSPPTRIRPLSSTTPVRYAASSR
jgi:ABC-type proline/glycine betaine transport system ATPase subunit